MSQTLRVRQAHREVVLVVVVLVREALRPESMVTLEVATRLRRVAVAAAVAQARQELLLPASVDNPVAEESPIQFQG
jgi:hypothetical protein